MAGRFIKLYDKILNWEWYSDINTFRLFIHLLLKANYKDIRFEGHVIKRGQLVTSLPSLSSQTGLTQRQIRVSLDRLKMTGELSSSSYPRYRIITILKYDEYQSDGRQNGSQMTDEMSVKGQAHDRLMTGSRQAHDRLMTASIDNIEQIEVVDTVEPVEFSPKGKSVDDPWFFEFWEAYPKKVGKQAAVKAWKKIKPDVLLMVKIMDGLRRWKESEQWTKENGQYIPYPETWLNKRRWEDEVKKAAPSVPQRRPSSADNFEQRDYSDVPMDDMARLKADIKAARKEGII